MRRSHPFALQDVHKSRIKRQEEAIRSSPPAGTCDIEIIWNLKLSQAPGRLWELYGNLETNPTSQAWQEWHASLQRDLQTCPEGKTVWSLHKLHKRCLLHLRRCTTVDSPQDSLVAANTGQKRGLSWPLKFENSRATRVTTMSYTWLVSSHSGPKCANQWIGLRENLQETIDFPIKYGVFL